MGVKMEYNKKDIRKVNEKIMRLLNYVKPENAGEIYLLIGDSLVNIGKSEDSRLRDFRLEQLADEPMHSRYA